VTKFSVYTLPFTNINKNFRDVNINAIQPSMLVVHHTINIAKLVMSGAIMDARDYTILGNLSIGYWVARVVYNTGRSSRWFIVHATTDTHAKLYNAGVVYAL